MLVHLHSDVLIVPGWGRVPVRLRPMAADAPRGRLPRAVVLMAAAMSQGLVLVVGAAGVPAGGIGLGRPSQNFLDVSHSRSQCNMI